MGSQVEAGDRQVTIDSWQPERRVFQIVAGEARSARVQTFFYPHWVATTEGQGLNVSPDADGAIRIALPAGTSKITLEFKEPARVRYADALTITGWILIALLLLARQPFPALRVKSQG
jgi:hypothetical protein